MIRSFSSPIFRGHSIVRKFTQARYSKISNESVKITPRAVNYAQWYQDVVNNSDLVDKSPVRGCMIMKPWGMAIWERLRDHLDTSIKATGAQNAYFPLFIPLSFLSKEAEHIDGFAKECAVVTNHRLCVDPNDSQSLVPDLDAKLEEPLVVRPTSETLIWHTLAKWIKSHRDLPMKLNQWANVVRWEQRPRAFLRTSEFLWQEGHTAHADKEDALNTTLQMLDLYADVCKNMLAVPVVKGMKSPSEKFAGAEDTYTIETLMQNGWALQAGTSHDLGQKFADAFDVHFLDKQGDRRKVWATSWGVSTRLMGALVMTHSDDIGLVLPPNLAPVQVVIVPIFAKTAQEKSAVNDAVDMVHDELTRRGVRVKVDDRDHVRPGAKFFEWERKGVPLRIEIGPRDVSDGIVVVKSRLQDSEKERIDLDKNILSDKVEVLLKDIHEQLYITAETRLKSNTMKVTSYQEMLDHFEKCDARNDNDKNNNNGDDDDDDDDDACMVMRNDIMPGFILAPWCDDAVNELKIKIQTRATIRCFPMDCQEEASGKTCFYSNKPATHMAIFARAF